MISIRPAPMSTEEQKGVILNCFVDLVTNQPDQFGPYLQHVGFDIDTVTECPRCWWREFKQAILAHYRIGKGKYDIERAANDLLTFPPVAAHVAELRKADRGAVQGQDSATDSRERSTMDLGTSETGQDDGALQGSHAGSL